MEVRRALISIAIATTAAMQLGQAPAPVPPSRKIPGTPPFHSWSLFLVCTPAWLTAAKSNDLQDLYERFRAFGETTGKDHAAVWFHRKTPHQASDLDTERMTEYCGRFGLVPSEGPHVVVTTVYPDAWKASADGAAPARHAPCES